MKKIVTLTVNPAIDKSTTVAGIVPNSKLRCSEPVYEPGGGGINISRVIKELGGTSHCAFLAGGPTGTHLEMMLADAGITQEVIQIQEWTRENLAVTDTTVNQQFRFGMPGPKVAGKEWKKILDRLANILENDDILVASGSLSPGIPTDFYAKVASIATQKNVRFVLDTSGDALIKGSNAGVFMLKPNLGELSALCGVGSISFSELEASARKVLENNTCEVMVVSLGAQGAIMLTKESVEYITAPIVHQKSTIGAGDSMVAGMLFYLAQGKSFSEMAQYGVACGTAATMSPGTQLCKKKNVDQLYKWISANTKKNDIINIIA